MSRRWAWAPALILALAVAVVAVRSRDAAPPLQPAAVGPSVSGAGLVEPAPTSASLAAAQPPGPARAAPGNAPAEAFQPLPGWTPTAYPTNTMPLDIAVTPRCGTPGTVMRAQIRTKPGVLVGVATQYTDNNYMPDYGFGESAPDGSFSWAWALRPDVPRGHSILKVAAGRSGVGQAAGDMDFMVADRC